MPTFYRITRSDPPTLQDFLSHVALNKPMPIDTPEARRLYEGISVYITTDAVRFTVGKYPKIGRYIATLEVPEDGSILHEQTTGNPAHYTLWADAKDLLERVTLVVAA